MAAAHFVFAQDPALSFRTASRPRPGAVWLHSSPVPVPRLRERAAHLAAACARLHGVLRRSPLSRMGLLHGYVFKDEIFWRLLSEIGDFLEKTVVLLQNYAHVVVAEIQRESLLCQ